MKFKLDQKVKIEINCIRLDPKDLKVLLKCHHKSNNL